jgi:cytosine/adenosine deaminase-related metal-dependent hydrolase
VSTPTANRLSNRWFDRGELLFAEIYPQHRKSSSKKSFSLAHSATAGKNSLDPNNCVRLLYWRSFLARSDRRQLLPKEGNPIMADENTFSRRKFLGAVAAVGAVGLSACATNTERTSRLWTADKKSGQLPPRDEFIVRGAYVVTMDPKLGDIPNGDVHVRNGALVAVGANLSAANAEVIDGRNRIACPGFVDTHFHLWGSFARGVVADGDFDYFPVMSRLGPVMTPEDGYNSSKLGITEAIFSGLTTIHDWSHNIIDGHYADADLRALRDSGIRARFSYGYSRALQQKPKETTDFSDIARVKRDWFGSSNEGLLTMGFASRGAGDTPPETYRKEWEFARSLSLPITQHAGRSLAEIKRFRRIEMLYNDKLLGPDVQLIHTYSASEKERAMMAETKVHNSIAPYTASRLASGLPYLGDLLKRGVQCSLSVDTTTVGGNADMFSIMRLMLQLNHLRSMNVTEVQPRRILELATLDGAKDLGIADRTGSLTPGKRADLILVRTNDINFSPFVNPALLLVQQANPSNVDTVVIDGRILKHKGELVAIDTEEVINKAAEAFHAARKRAGGPY